MDIEALRRHALVFTDEDGNSRDRYTLFKSLVFDTSLEGAEGETFHLCEGNWYKIDNDYITRLSNYLDPLCAKAISRLTIMPARVLITRRLPPATPALASYRKNISPDGQSQVEPCDLLAARDGVAAFYHVKVSTLSAQLSHLFNQGINAVQLMRLEEQAVDKLEALIRDGDADGLRDPLVALIRDRKYRIVFGIVTRKDPASRSQNLPLFSRISLMRGMMSFILWMCREV